MTCCNFVMQGYYGMTVAKENYTGLSNDIADVSQKRSYGEMFRWKKFPVTIFIGNVPSLYRDVVITSVNRWTTYFPFEISDDPNSDVNIVWVSNLFDSNTQFNNPYAVTSQIINNKEHKCIIKVRYRIASNNELTVIMLHELGHVVGLDDSRNSGDIMYPFPEGLMAYMHDSSGKFFLSQRDFDNLAKIYKNSSGDNINQINNYQKLSIKYNSTQNVYNKDSISNYINEGNNFYYNHNYNKAIECYKKVLDIYPNNPTVNGNVGLCYLMIANYDLAIDYTNKAIAVNPNREDYYVDLGLSYKGKNLYDKAIENYKKAISVNPNCINAYVNLGSIYVDTGKYDLAIVNCQKAIDINPNFELAYVNMGAAYENKGEHHKARALFEKALLINPNSTLAKNNNQYIANKSSSLSELNSKNIVSKYINEGINYSKVGNYTQAIECFKKAILINQNSSAAYIDLGVVYYNLGRYDEAIENYQVALKINPNEVGGYINLGNAYAKKKSYNKALELYKKALVIDPTSTVAKENYNSLNNFVKNIQK